MDLFRRALLGLALLGFLALGTRPAHAQFFTNSAGLSSPATTITFSEVPLTDDTSLTTQYSAYGVTFSGLYYNPDPAFSSGPISPPDAGNYTG